MKFLYGKNDEDIYRSLQPGDKVYVVRPDIEAETFMVLEGIMREALSLESKGEKARAVGDKNGNMAIHERLLCGLLPQACRIMEGPGSHVAFSYFVVGLIYRALAMPENAEPMFKKSLAIQPHELNTLLELTYCLGEQNRFHEALAYALQAVDVSPESASAWGNLAMCHIQCGNKQEARKAIDHALSLDPQDRKNRYIDDNFDRYFK